MLRRRRKKTRRARFRGTDCLYLCSPYPVPLLQLTCVSYAPDSGMKPAIQNIWVLARRYFQTQTAPDIQNLTVFLKALFQNSAEKSLAARGAIVANCGAATPRRVVMRHGGGTECDLGVLSAKRKRERVLTRPIARHLEGAEVMFRRTEPLGGGAARRRKRASRGYMLPYLCCRHS